MFADVDTKANDDQERENDDDAKDDYHHPVVTFPTSQTTGKS